MDFVAANVFDLLPQLETGAAEVRLHHSGPAGLHQEPQNRAATPCSGYKEINYRAMKLLPRGGYLATCSCSHFATEEMFVARCSAAPPADAGRAAAADRGPAAGPRPPHPLGRGRNGLSEVLSIPSCINSVEYCEKDSDTDASESFFSAPKIAPRCQSDMLPL